MSCEKYSDSGTLVENGCLKVVNPEIPLDGDIALRALALRELHSDPFDLFIAASAMGRRARLITSDRVVLGWKLKHLALQNACE